MRNNSSRKWKKRKKFQSRRVKDTSKLNKSVERRRNGWNNKHLMMV